jgi:hypothetical protein
MEQRIQAKRKKELGRLAAEQYMVALLICFIYFFPSMMPTAGFVTYVGFKFKPALDLPTATTCLVFYDLVSSPMFQVPMAVTSFLQLMVSLKRIQKFLEVPEVQKNLRSPNLYQTQPSRYPAASRGAFPKRKVRILTTRRSRQILVKRKRRLKSPCRTTCL